MSSLRRKSDTVLKKPTTTLKKPVEPETKSVSNTEKAIVRLVDEIGRAKEDEKAAKDITTKNRAELEEIDGERKRFDGRTFKVEFTDKDGRETLNKDLLLENLMEHGLKKSIAQEIIKNSHKKGKGFREMSVSKL